MTEDPAEPQPPDTLRHALARGIAGRLWDEVAQGRAAGNDYGSFNGIVDQPRNAYVRWQGRAPEFLQDADAVISLVNRYVAGAPLTGASRPIPRPSPEAT